MSDDAVRVQLDIGADWLQGRTAFGGLTGVLGLQAMRDAATAAGTPGAAAPALRALQTSFVGPLGEGPATLDAHRLRAGRNLSQFQVTLRQDGRVTAVLLGVFGTERASQIPPVAPRAPHTGFLPSARPPASGEPAFRAQFDFCWESGPPPGSGGQGLDSRIHMRLRERAGLDDELLAVLLADVPPTPATGHVRGPVPASSVTWALEMQPLPPGLPADGWWRSDNESIAVAGGYASHAARLWAPDGTLAALSSQLVAIFA
ncbi:thioesterase family protein [Piscinibacter sakaiensis]|uniref:thioesterase family protein n=1 Tax=Piscinibacter sakaiensis TaxID=1547922 RepID=UPI003727E909